MHTFSPLQAEATSMSSKSRVLVLLPLSSYRPILDHFAHIFVAPQSPTEGYATSLRQAQDIASRLDLNKNIL